MADVLSAGTVPPPIPPGATAAGLAGLGGMFPGFAGYGLDGSAFAGLPAGAYVPVTPLGSLAALKGDLLVPVVAVGVAIFLLIIIVLAVKAALAWKIDLLDKAKLGVGSKFLRAADVDPKAHNEERVNELAAIVMDALDSERCLDKIICSIGSYGQGSSWASYFSMVESLVSEEYRPKLSVMKSCAEGKQKVEDFQCGRDAHAAAGAQASQQADGQQGNAANAKPGKLPILSTLGSNASLKPQAAGGAVPKPADAENRI